METPKPARLYRVVGIRQDGSRVVTGSALSQDEARRIRRRGGPFQNFRAAVDGAWHLPVVPISSSSADLTRPRPRSMPARMVQKRRQPPGGGWLV